MLDEDGDEALHRPERRAVDDDRAVLLPVRARVFELEAVGHHIVHLHGAQLPLAAERIADDEVNLRAVEGGLALADEVVEAHLVGHVLDLALGAFPERRVAAVLVGIVVAEGQARGHVHPERLEDELGEVHHALDLVLELVVGGVEVGVVLREAAHTGEAVKLAGLLVAVDRAELGEAHGQVAVRPGLARVHLVVVRAVHRLEQVRIVLALQRHRRVLAVGVVRVVAGRFVEVEVADVGRDDLVVAAPPLLVAQEAFERAAQHRALGQPHRKPAADLRRDHKQLQLLAELAVVAALGLFAETEELVKLRLLGEGDAVEPGELRAGDVAAPVRSGDVEQLDGLDRPGARQVRPPAQVGEVALLVERDLPVVQPVQQFELVRIVLGLEVRDGVGLGDVFADERHVAAGQFDHLGLDGRQVVGRERLGAAFDVREVDVVVKPLFDGRADAEADAGVQRFQRLGHQVRRRVPEGHLAVGVVPRQDLQRAVGVEGAVEFLDRSVVADGEGVAGKAFGDGASDVAARRAVRHDAHGSVGEGQANVGHRRRAK